MAIYESKTEVEIMASRCLQMLGDQQTFETSVARFRQLVPRFEPNAQLVSGLAAAMAVHGVEFRERGGSVTMRRKAQEGSVQR